MPLRFGACCVWLIALLVTAASAAQPTSNWLSARTLSEPALVAMTQGDSVTLRPQRVRANLTLADRALNQATGKAQTHLERAESEIEPGTDAAAFALAIRCQLEHRQGRTSAKQTCAPLVAGQFAPESLLVHAYGHATLSYYYYREGRHDLSLDAANATLDAAEELQDHDLLAAANNMLGLHFGTQLRPRMSLSHFETAFSHAVKMAYPEFKAVIQLNLASSYTYLGRATEALEILREARSSPVVSIYPTRRLVVQSMISQARVALGDTVNAERDLLAVIDEVKDNVLPDGMTFGYTGLGVVQLAENRYTEALENFDRVLAITKQDFITGLDHPRIQLIVVPYAVALRGSGRIDEARQLLSAVIDSVPSDKPDQLLVDACNELAMTLSAAGDWTGAREAARLATQLEIQLWDASYQYQVARLNNDLTLDRQRLELERSQERAAALFDKAQRETTLKRLSWLLAAMIVAMVILTFSRGMQKRVAHAERSANERLEDLVETRTRELEDEMAERLRVEVEGRQLSEKLLENDKMHALGQLTAGVAHDFNNLMTVVGLAAERLKAGDGSNAETADMLDGILAAADSGAKITDGLLAYARKQPLKPTLIRLDLFLKDAERIFSNTLGERHELRTNFEKCWVKVDAGQLTTALLNLVLNAREAMPVGGVVTLSLHTEEHKAVIAVRDSGKGMKQDTLQRAFEPFFTTKQSGEGTGLGLSMVHGFAGQSGGEVTIDTEVDEGTCVMLSLPLVEDGEMAQSVDPLVRQPIGHGLKALVVEDRDQLLRMLRLTLEHLGLHVSVASNAAEAIEQVDTTGQPDVLISDIIMPGEMDGIGLAAHLREYNPELPVLLISGYSDLVDEDCVFLRKPFSISQFEQAIVETLHRPVSQSVAS